MAERLDGHGLSALAAGRHGDPFAVLGPHRVRGGWVVRAVAPHATRLEVLLEDGEVHDAIPLGGGVFEARLTAAPGRYRLRLDEPGGTRVAEDPYRFGPDLGELDLHLIGEGRHERLWEALGANERTIDDCAGVRFAVWAPNARRVSVVGDFNHWDGRCHPMRHHPGAGVWELFVPGLATGALYQYELIGATGRPLPLKADPIGKRMGPPPGNASIVEWDRHQWQDDAWMAQRANASARDRAMSIYEVHVGSWRHYPGRRPAWRDLARDLVDYVVELGFTHIELLPISEHPFEGSWGYQPLGLYAPTWRHGSPDDFRYFVDACHQAGLGVILDWVPAHFPRDEYGLARFDGTCLYEHEDPRQGAHRDWGTLIYNFGRAEVVNFLVASALWWVESFHIDALRVDAVASMLYLDYSREPGEWVPNRFGGNQNLEAVEFMQRLNDAVHARGAVTMAEESTAWPQVSQPAESGGLGYSYKWNMGWMHDTLAYLQEDSLHRRYHHQRLTFGLLYAFTENFILPLSHDEVVHGKGTLLDRMPGDRWQQFANLRAAFAFQFGYPGKKLLFMGGEFAQTREWSHDRALDWELLGRPAHHGVAALVRDLNRLYSGTPALHELDCEPAGFAWVDCEDRDRSVIAFLRFGRDPAEHAMVVCNFTPVPREDYRLGVPRVGAYHEALNTDAGRYGGSGVGNPGGVQAQPKPAHGHPASVSLTLPPLGVLVLLPGAADAPAP